MAFQELVARQVGHRHHRSEETETHARGRLLEVNGLAWTAEGNEIWFAESQRVGLGNLRGTLSGDVRLILRFPGPIELEDLAPDGRVLINRFTAQTGIRYLAPGARRRRICHGSTGPVTDLSADGQWLLFSEFGEGAALKAPCISARPTAHRPSDWERAAGSALSPDGKWALTMTRSRQELALLPVGVGEPRSVKLPDGFDRFELGNGCGMDVYSSRR